MCPDVEKNESQYKAHLQDMFSNCTDSQTDTIYSGL